MEDQPENAGSIRNEKGQFYLVSGNPAGKPVGTVSVVAKIRQKFLEDPAYFDEWVSKLMEDGKERRAIMEQLDGKPKQSVELGGKDSAPLEVIVGMRVMKDGA